MTDILLENKEWLDGYDLEYLVGLYKINEPIKEAEEEQYKSYFEYANSEYINYQILEKYKDSIKELLVSNYGKIKYNGKIIPSTLVSDGPNKGIEGGKYDHYREILFPALPIKRYIFKTYRLVAEAWCTNPAPKDYTIVHHIGNDSYDNMNNLLFVTQNQHLSIHSSSLSASRLKTIKKRKEVEDANRQMVQKQIEGFIAGAKERGLL
jgi:hypothetical protein